ncbi:hypothetical protein LCM00_12405 [Bacillus infantis]|uniref:hypothetical protein n=1 Tax=Bacillus infantis TaxID=324767 RepID=UPI001CD2F496|nr:hypothetical protein [Bacillus infantis]MCA1040306.1 hypothetical protein [Bacillus infantis]
MSTDQNLETLIEMLIKITGRSNERIGQLEKRIEQLEFVLRNMPQEKHQNQKIRRIH